MTQNSKKRTVIFYHKHCDDGFGAAWAAWKKFGAKADYIAYYHKDNIPNVVTGADVYLLDLALPEASMHTLKRKASSITVIDHHGTGEEASKLANTRVFNLGHSGAFLAWQFFHPDKPVPKLLRHIEDGDLWRWKLANSKAILAALGLIEMDFGAWGRFMLKLENKTKQRELIAQGKLLLAYRANKIDDLFKIAERGKIDGHEALIINAPLWQSELGHKMYSGIAPSPSQERAGGEVGPRAPVAIIWWKRPGKLVVSLRSDGTVNVAKIAESFGGGGHPAAAAFTLPPDDFKTILSFYRR
ncbi:MAG: hypothetical protein COV10_02990 [Candidatus Vogelbacteria bacterium CG10_big_fil_rev_8_21_14_0_10_51_16]|uniref:DHHA1 domain-containing protein n=1 Tax=Candidatus Vogelbacteria bacterium CG10_big_fil_rev_8_21_14_0_10_51_16 TaxID=1975045 RepID=A0A2H0RFM4_9BACT|nr:MAG: hypothetical protein COV10_02990 [Candidatus Vogelbacteria bacterium CG10_big_fil_rev_8_21_14_0_10_51_16]